eukprot:jgi/Picre1/31939/NNA_007287.t1
MSQGFDFITDPHSLQDLSFLMFPPDCDYLEDTLDDCFGSLSFRDIENYLKRSPSPSCVVHEDEVCNENGKPSDLPIKAVWSGKDPVIAQQHNEEASENIQQKISLSYVQLTENCDHPIKTKRRLENPVRCMRKLAKSIVRPAKAMSNAVNQASSAVTGKARSIRSFFSGLQFPCLSKPDCKA